MDYLGDDNTAVLSNTVKQGLSLTCADPAVRNLGSGDRSRILDLESVASASASKASKSSDGVDGAYYGAMIENLAIHHHDRTAAWNYWTTVSL